MCSVYELANIHRVFFVAVAPHSFGRLSKCTLENFVVQLNMQSRNSACSCGSGSRYKDCHGAIVAPVLHKVSADDVALSGLTLHREGKLVLAAEQYSEALRINPTHFNSLHMMGVIELQQHRVRDCLQWLRQAGQVVDWAESALLSNLRLAISALLLDLHHVRCLEQRAVVARSRFAAAEAASERSWEPVVSVIVPSYCHARYIEKALRSVYIQTWRHIELIVIDDGSSDQSVEVIRSVLAESPFPTHFIHRENRGAHATINEGLALATGDYINILNSDDQFTTNRVERLVEAIARRGRQWGFARCKLIDDAGLPITAPHESADALQYVMDKPLSSFCATDYLLHCNPSVSSGNIFVSRALALNLGGFSAYRYNHDWQFCLDAVLVEEPCVLTDELYVYRLHGSNTISENRDAARREAQQMLHAWFERTAQPYAATNALAGTAMNDPLFWASTQLHAKSPPSQIDGMIATLLAATNVEATSESCLQGAQMQSTGYHAD